MDAVIEQFAREYHAYHNITEKRRREQTKTLYRFEDYLGRPIITATPRDLSLFLLHLVEDTELAPSMVYKVRGMIRPFYKWAVGVDLITREEKNAIFDVESPRFSEIPDDPRPYSRKELDAFYTALAEALPLASKRTLTWWTSGRMRYRRSIYQHGMRLQVEALSGLALYCGLRRSELYDVSLDDIAPENDYIVVRKGKNGKPRTVPYPDTLRKLIRAWLAWRSSMNPDHDHVWLALTRQATDGPSSRMNRRRFDNLLPKVVAPGWTWHRFRHTCGTEWLRAGMRLEKVQRLLGHENLDMTLRYTKIIDSDVAKSMLNAEARFAAAVGPREAVAA